MKTEIVRIPVEPARAEELSSRIRNARTGYLAEPRCAGLRVLRGADEIVAVIDWESESAHDEANAAEEAQSFFGAVQELAAGAPLLGWYEEA